MNMEKKNDLIKESFKDYLANVKLDHELTVTADKMISFHWANWNVTCRMIKEGPLCLYTKEAIIDELDKRLEKLRDQKIWVKDKIKTIESNCYDLYNFYLDPRVRQTWFTQKQSTLYSDESQKGPFTLLTSLKWKSRETLSYFIYKKILSENQQLRQFRLNANLKFKIKVDEFVQNDSFGFIRQFNNNGILVQFPSRGLKSKLKNKSSIKFEFDLKDMQSILSFLEVTQWPFNEKCSFSIPIHLLNNCMKLDDSENIENFVFIPFYYMESQLNARYLINIFKDLVFQVYSQFDEVLSEELSTFHTWVQKVA